MEKDNNKKYQHAPLISPGHTPVSWDALENMNETIAKVGGTLHFIVEKENDGWHAECTEFPSIIAGGRETEPNADIVEKKIREAIHCAFNVSSNIPSHLDIRNFDRPSFRTLYQHV